MVNYVFDIWAFIYCFRVSKLTTDTCHGWLTRCCLVCEMHPENIQKTFPKHPEAIPKSSRKHPQIIQKASPNHSENIPKSSRKHPQIIQKASPNHPENTPKTSRTYPPKHPENIQKRHLKTSPKTCVCIV